MNTPDDNQLSLFGTPEPPSKFSFYDWEIDREGYENSIGISEYPNIENEASKLHLNDNTDTICSDTWICFQELEDSASQQSNLEESRQLSLWKSTPTLRQSCDCEASRRHRTSQKFQSIQTSETTSQNQESSIYSQWNSPVLAHQTQEVEQDSNIQLHHFGERDLDVLLKFNPASVLSNNEHPFVPQRKLWEHQRCSKELSDGDFELFLGDFLWQDTLGKLAMCRAFGSDRRKTTGKALLSAQQSLARVIKGSDYLSTRRLDMLLNQKHPPPSFPTLTSNVSTTSANRSFSAGQTALLRSQSSKTTIWALALREKWFKDNGLIPSGYQLGTRAIALIMGFPSGWFEGLTEQYWNKTSTQSQGASLRLASRPPRGDDLRERAAPQVELEPGISQDEQLHQLKQRSPSAESLCEAVSSSGIEISFRATSTVLLGGDNNSPLSTESSSSFSRELSIPCLVKQSKQLEVKGVIRKDEGDRFLVEVENEIISFSKLFVYPDFSESVGQIPPTKRATPPSKNSSTKVRRKKGDGTGYIYRRTVTRKGKQYQESYFRYRDESGKLKAKYIPQRLLDKVQEAESAKKPIADILVLLGGDEISRGEHSSTSDDNPLQTSQTPAKSDEPIFISRGEQVTPPSNKRRKQGEGTGYIECKPIKRGGNEYKQYWYHYEEWREGDRTTKKSRYIPKRLVAKVEKMEAEKVSVREILAVLISKGKRSQK